jgi:choline-sulfatase
VVARNIFGLALAVLAACAPGRDAAPPARHLILITLDTLRADRLGCYGNRDVATPHLDRLAREGALAAEASAPTPITRPSHTSLLTGLYPAEHGIRDNVSRPLAHAVPTLAEILRAAGFRTAAFVSSVVLSSQSGLSRGFETYSDRFEVGEDNARFLNTVQKRGDLPTAEAIDWLAAHSKERLFLWLHLYDPHDPYEPPEPYASRYAGRPYDGEVAWSDELVGRLLAAIEKQGLKDQTLLVATSDHGEGLGDHGEAGHGFFVYESTLRVPLLLRGPRIPPGSRLETPFRLVDFLPTVLDLLEVSPPADPSPSGRSLALALAGGEPPPEEPSYAETLVPLLHYGWSDLHAIRSGRFKYIRAPRPELYDLKKDPGETSNLVTRESKQAKSLAARLEEWRGREGDPESVRVKAGDIPADLREKLGALGYLGAGSSPSPSTEERADPKDKLEEFEVVNGLVREGLTHLREKSYGESAARFRSLLARGVESFEVHYYLGRALAGAGKAKQAVIHFEKALLRDPDYVAAYRDLADARIALRDFPGAIAALRQGQARSPKDPRFFDREGEIWQSLKKPREAIRAYKTVAELAPKDALVRVRLGELYRDLGEGEKALGFLRKAVELEPEVASYWNSLGMVLGGEDSFPAAEEAFRKASTLDPKNPQYSYNLGLALLRQGRSGEAASYFEKTLTLEPRFKAARERLAETRSR